MKRWDDAGPLISPQLQNFSIPRRSAADSNGGAGLTDLDKKLMEMAGVTGGGALPNRESHQSGAGHSSGHQSGGFKAGGQQSTGDQRGGHQPGGYQSVDYQSGGYNPMFSAPPPPLPPTHDGSPAAPQKRRFEESGQGKLGWANKFDKPLPEEIIALCRLFHCELCEVKLTSDVISAQHYAGRAHEKKVVAALEAYAKRTGEETAKKRKVDPVVQEMPMDESRLANWQARFQGIYDLPLPASILVMCRPNECQICVLPLNSTPAALSHYTGKNHEKNLRPILIEYCQKNNQPVPKKIEDTQEETRCELCNVDYTSPIMARSHINGKLHQKRLKSGVPKIEPVDESGRFGIGRSFVDGAPAHGEVEADFGGQKTPVKKAKGGVGVEPNCEVCGITANSQANLDAHLRGKLHAKKLAAASAPPSVTVVPAAGEFNCEICGVWAKTAIQLQGHLDGKSHKKKVLLTSQGGQLRCDLCNVNTTDAGMLHSHMVGKNHMKMLRQKGQLMASATPSEETGNPSQLTEAQSQSPA